MPDPIRKIPSPPSPPKSSEPKTEFSFVSWIGRIFRWLIGGSDKTDHIARSRLAITPDQEFQSEKLEERFEHNYDAVLHSKAEDIPFLKVVDGKLDYDRDGTTKQDQDNVKDLIRQTHRQAWGKLIDAKYGLAIQEEQLQRLNDLNAHLAQAFPDLLKSEDPEKPLAILSSQFGKAPAKVMDKKLMEVHREVQREARERVTVAAQHLLTFTPITGLESGVNPTQFVKDQKTGAKLAISKSERDEIMSFEEAKRANQEVSDAQMKVTQRDLTFLGGFHETLAAQLNVLLEGKLGIPLALQGETTSVHSFVDNVGNLYDFVEARLSTHTTEECLNLLPIAPSQRLVFAELVTKNCDCHGGNILITLDGEPVPIDFGRILSERKLRAAYLNFPCLDQPVNEGDKRYFEQLDVEESVRKLKIRLEAQYPLQFKDPRIARLLNAKLEMLKARLYMVKMGIAAGLNQRQLIAMDLPPLSDQTENKFNEIMKRQLPMIQTLAAAGAKGEILSIKEAIFDYATAEEPVSGFDAAWESCFDRSTSQLDLPRFRAQLELDFKRIQAIPIDKLYTEREVKIYGAGNIDVRVED